MADERLIGDRDVVALNRAVISTSASGDTTVVAAVAGKKIRVLDYTLSFGGTVNAKWKSGSTDKTGLLYGTAGVLVSPAHSRDGIIETAVSEALVLNLSGAVAVGGHLTYLEV